MADEAMGEAARHGGTSRTREDAPLRRGRAAAQPPAPWTGIRAATARPGARLPVMMWTHDDGGYTAGAGSQWLRGRVGPVSVSRPAALKAVDAIVSGRGDGR
jgi:hypothetical protein